MKPVGLLPAVAPWSVLAANATLSTLVSIPSQDTFRILPSFTGNVSEGYINTQTNNKTIKALLTEAKDAAFISYDPEFLQIFGDSPEAVLIQQRATPFAFEAAVWVYDRNEVWFTSSVQVIEAGQSTQIYHYNLLKNSITHVTPSVDVVNPNGGYYFDGLVYFTTSGNSSVAPSVVSIDPTTYKTEIILNSYFGLPFNFIDDIAIVPAHHDGNGISTPHMYFTDVDYGFYVNRTAQLPNAVWRYTPSTQALVPVISRADILGPNGVRVNANGTKLYVGEYDSGGATTEVGSANPPGSSGIYEFDLDTRGFPINKRLIGLARQGAADGMHIDDYGRVWTGEGEGIVVRDTNGKILGLLNADVFREKSETGSIAQFVLAGDLLVVLALERLWKVQLAQTVVRAGSFGN